MPRAKIRFEASGEGGVSHAFVQLKEMRMSPADTDPDDLRPAFPWKSSDLAQRQEESREMDAGETGAQFLLRSGIHIAEESQGEMNLFGREPAETGNLADSA